MSENLNLDNLFLDDNSFTTVPEGDYHFTVDSYDLEYSTSDKFPENTQVIVVHMSVPVMVDGAITNASVKQSLPVCSKMLFLIRQFMECIGLLPEKGRAKMPPLDDMIGKTGIIKLLVEVSNRGNEYNKTDTLYAPSKAPTVCANDDAWNKRGEGFESTEVNPFV